MTNSAETPKGSPFKQLPTILQGHINLSQINSELERSYVLGWIRTMLPDPLDTVGLNPKYVDAMSLVGKELEKPQMIFHHQGSLISFLSFIHFIPSSKTAIVTLTNSMNNNDAADWLGQLLVKTVWGNSEPNEYVKLASDSVKTSNNLWPQMTKELERSRILNTPLGELSDYVGSYFNVVKVWHMKLWVEEDKLYTCHQNDRSQAYQLKHYNYDTFSWLLTRDKTVRRGLFPVTMAEYYLLAFVRGETGQIDHVI